jgi:hypothetical protein
MQGRQRPVAKVMRGTGFFILNSSKYPDALSLKTIDIIKPDIVIVEVVERFFDLQLLGYRC